MPQLPDATALGVRPTPTPANMAAPVPDTRGVRYALADLASENDKAGAIANRQALVNAQSAQQTVQSVTEPLNNFVQQWQSRQDAVNTADALSKYSTKADEELRRVQVEGDIGDLKTGQAYTKGLSDTQEEILKGFNGSADAAARLRAQMDGVRTHFTSQAASAGLDAQQSKIASIIGGQVNALAGEAYNNPARLAELYQGLDSTITSMAGALTPEMEQKLKERGRNAIAVGAVRSALDQNALGTAKKMLNDPGIAQALTPDQAISMGHEIRAQSQAMQGASLKQQGYLNELDYILGAKAAPAAQARYLANRASGMDAARAYEVAKGSPLNPDEQGRATGGSGKGGNFQSGSFTITKTDPTTGEQKSSQYAIFDPNRGLYVTPDASHTPIDINEPGTRVIKEGVGTSRLLLPAARVVNAGLQLAESLRNLSEMGTNAKGSLYGNEEGGWLSHGALTNAMTPPDIQRAQTIGMGIGRSLSVMDASGALPTESFTKQMSAAEMKFGDKVITRLQKFAESRQIGGRALVGINGTGALTPQQSMLSDLARKVIARSIPFTARDVQVISEAARTNPAVQDVLDQVDKPDTDLPLSEVRARLEQAMGREQAARLSYVPPELTATERQVFEETLKETQATEDLGPSAPISAPSASAVAPQATSSPSPQASAPPAGTPPIAQSHVDWVRQNPMEKVNAAGQPDPNGVSRWMWFDQKYGMGSWSRFTNP